MNPYGERIDAATIRFERLLPGPIDRVWSYLVEPEKRMKWFCAGAFDLRPGGRAEFHFDHRRLTDEKPPKKYEANGAEVNMTGVIVEAEPPRLLVFDWPDPSGANSRVRIELAEAGGKVRLTLTHSRLSTREALLDVASGWHGHLDILDAVLSATPAPGFWGAFERLLADYDKRLKA